MLTVTKRLTFCAAHRLMDYPGACARLHGHNYVVLVTAASKGLDPLGMAVDFGTLKRECQGWLDDRWDHGTILNEADPIMPVLEQVAGAARVGQRLVTMVGNPTAENMALLLLREFGARMEPHGITVEKVVVYETETACAEATRDEH